MQTIRWNKKKVYISVALFLLFYVVFSTGYNQFTAQVVIKKTKPEEVWKFASDFSKMKILNPTIIDFVITSDRGRGDHWKYSVRYRERLSHWPYWLNVANADYVIKKLTPQEGGNYLVESVHKTCFFNGYYCLKSKGEFNCTKLGLADTQCTETIYYQCPPFLGIFCRREVEFQRSAIMQNLTNHFISIKTKK